MPKPNEIWLRPLYMYMESRCALMQCAPVLYCRVGSVSRAACISR